MHRRHSPRQDANSRRRWNAIRCCYNTSAYMHACYLLFLVRTRVRMRTSHTGRSARAAHQQRDCRDDSRGDGASCLPWGLSGSDGFRIDAQSVEIDFWRCLRCFVCLLMDFWQNWYSRIQTCDLYKVGRTLSSVKHNELTRMQNCILGKFKI